MNDLSVPVVRRSWTVRWPPEVLLLLAVAVAVLSFAPLNTDTAYGMVAARRLLGGAHLYVDLLETNPPLIFWIFMLPAGAGRWLPLSDAQLVGALVGVLLVLSTIAALHVLALDSGRSRFTRSVLLTTFVTAVVVPYFAWTGQREQVAAILAFPYCLVASNAARGVKTGKGLAIFCGLLAGIGLAIKPFFLLTWLSVECVVVAVRGWRQAVRLDSAVIASVQAVYALVILVFTTAYVTRMVPMAAALYDGYGNQLSAGIRSGRFVGVSIVAGAAIASLLLRRFRDTGDAGILGAATMGWLLAFVAQRKGWAYHLIPAFVYGSVCAMAACVEWLQAPSDVTNRRTRFAAAATVIPVAGVLAWAAPAVPDVLRAMSRGIDGPREIEVAMADMVGRLAEGEPVCFLSTSMWPGFPVVNMTHSQWPYHYHFMWPIPALYQGRRGVEPSYRSLEEQSPLERQFFDTVIDDLTRVPPKLLVVDYRPSLAAMNGRRFDFIRYFSASDRFRVLLAQYSAIGRVAEWEVYERR